MKLSIRRLSVVRRRTSFNRATSRPLCEALEQRQLLAAAFDSAFGFGATFDDVGTGSAMDSAGNSYLTGYFSGTIDIDPGPGTFNVSTDSDPTQNARPYGSFVAKYDSSGNLVWGRQLLPTTDSVFSWDVAITPSGDVFVGGKIEAEPSRAESIFISKLDKSGNLLWTLNSRQSGGGIINSIAADPSGNVYATGSFGGTLDVDNDGTPELTGGSHDLFVLKVDGSGHVQWAKGLSADGDAMAIAVDAKGDAYTTGFFANTADFDPGPGVFNMTAANGGAFIQKLDKDGNFVWARSFNGAPGFTVQGMDVDVDAAGNVFSTGEFGGTVDFDPGAGTYNISAGGPANMPTSNVYISKLNSAGNFVWAARAAESADIQSYQAKIALDGRGNVYVGATFSGQADFDQRPGGCSDILIGTEDMFLLKLNSSGQYVWAEQISSDQRVTPRDIAANAAGRIAVAGDFEGTTDFDPGPDTHNVSSVSSVDGFLLRLRDQVAASASSVRVRKAAHHKSAAQMRKSQKAAVKRLKAQIKAARADGQDVSELRAKLREARAALKE